jgi:hypothetical protein
MNRIWVPNPGLTKRWRQAIVLNQKKRLLNATTSINNSEPKKYRFIHINKKKRRAKIGI